jgi:hypothetical protein
MNETSEWWVALLETKTQEARAHAEKTFRTTEKQNLFMDSFHWAMLNTRSEIWEKLETTNNG